MREKVGVREKEREVQGRHKAKEGEKTVAAEGGRWEGMREEGGRAGGREGEREQDREIERASERGS